MYSVCLLQDLEFLSTALISLLKPASMRNMNWKLVRVWKKNITDNKLIVPAQIPTMTYCILDLSIYTQSKLHRNFQLLAHISYSLKLISISTLFFIHVGESYFPFLWFMDHIFCFFSDNVCWVMRSIHKTNTTFLLLQKPMKDDLWNGKACRKMRTWMWKLLLLDYCSPPMLKKKRLWSSFLMELSVIFENHFRQLMD